jgi:hypothetical protein
MRTVNVSIGDEYSVMVSGRLARVRVTSTSIHGGWNGLNVATGRTIHIRSARRLRANLSAVDRAKNDTTLDAIATMATFDLIAKKAELCCWIATHGQDHTDRPMVLRWLTAVENELHARATAEPFRFVGMSDDGLACYEDGGDSDVGEEIDPDGRDDPNAFLQDEPEYRSPGAGWTD